MNTGDLQSRIINRLTVSSTRLDRSLYELHNKTLFLFRTSKAHEVSKSTLLYWFGFHKNRLEIKNVEKLFIIFVCGNESQCIVIPGSKMIELLDGVQTALDDNWKIKIYEIKGFFELALTGKENVNLTQFLNKFPFSKLEQTQRETNTTQSEETNEEVSIEDSIMSLDGVDGKSLHDRLINMLRDVGEWMGYKAIPEYTIRPDAPYRLDVAWMQNESIHIAVEVQVGGNVTEAKDRLILARKFGARKLIIVSTPEHIDGIKSVFRYEGDSKHWLEIWGIESVYSMFVEGRSFFETFNQFNKHQYRDDVIEIV